METSSTLTTPSGEATAPASAVESDFVIGGTALSPSELAAGFSRDPAAGSRQQNVGGVIELTPEELAVVYCRTPVTDSAS